MELKDMDEGKLLLERMKFDRGESKFTNKEINDQCFKNMKKLVGKNIVGVKIKGLCIQCETVIANTDTENSKWCSLECKEAFFQKYYGEKVPYISLDLKKESWENLFECIRLNKIEAKGNFWAAIQYLEFQLKDEVK